MIPDDPMMLLSFVNMKLRDEYPTLDELCAGIGIDRRMLESKLGDAGFEYSEENRKFW